MQVHATINGTARADLVFTTRHSEKPYCIEYVPGEVTVEFSIDNAPVDQLRILVKNKTEGYIQLLKLFVDSIDLQHSIYSGTFYPNYNVNYYQTQHPPESYSPATEWYHNGEWCLDITKPIWEYMVKNYA